MVTVSTAYVYNDLDIEQDLFGASKESVHVIFHRLKAAEYKKKKKLQPKSSSTKERQKYYDLILKRLEGFMES